MTARDSGSAVLDPAVAELYGAFRSTGLAPLWTHPAVGNDPAVFQALAGAGDASTPPGVEVTSSKQGRRRRLGAVTFALQRRMCRRICR